MAPKAPHQTKNESAKRKSKGMNVDVIMRRMEVTRRAQEKQFRRPTHLQIQRRLLLLNKSLEEEKALIKDVELRNALCPACYKKRKGQKGSWHTRARLTTSSTQTGQQYELAPASEPEIFRCAMIDSTCRTKRLSEITTDRQFIVEEYRRTWAAEMETASRWLAKANQRVEMLTTLVARWQTEDLAKMEIACEHQPDPSVASVSQSDNNSSTPHQEQGELVNQSHRKPPEPDLAPAPPKSSSGNNTPVNKRQTRFTSSPRRTPEIITIDEEAPSKAGPSKSILKPGANNADNMALMLREKEQCRTRREQRTKSRSNSTPTKVQKEIDREHEGRRRKSRFDQPEASIDSSKERIFAAALKEARERAAKIAERIRRKK